jgi:hypothetical protein
MSEIAAVIYPVPHNLVDRFFVSENKSVFVRYLGRTSTIRLAPKSKVIFYASGKSKELIGEGVIDEIEFLTPDEVLSKYGNKVFLNEKELDKYVHLRPNRTSSKKMLTINFSKLRKYSHPIRTDKRITMAGQYLTKKEYSEVVNRASESVRG